MIKPDLIVYVRCNDIELLQRRIKRRARSEEANIDPVFLRQVIRDQQRSPKECFSGLVNYEFCYCSCLPLLPQLAQEYSCNLESTISATLLQNEKSYT